MRGYSIIPWERRALTATRRLAATRAAVDLARLRIKSSGRDKISATLFEDSYTILFHRNETLSSPPPGTVVKTITVTRNAVVTDG